MNELWDEKNYQSHLVNIDPERQELYETCQRRRACETRCPFGVLIVENMKQAAELFEK